MKTLQKKSNKNSSRNDGDYPTWVYKLAIILTTIAGYFAVQYYIEGLAKIKF